MIIKVRIVRHVVKITRETFITDLCKEIHGKYFIIINVFYCSYLNRLHK